MGEESKEGYGSFDTHIDACVAVVTNPNHEKFGEVARITFHDWKEYGMVGVRFEDGSIAEFEDGMMSTDAQLPGVRILRRDDDEAINALVSGLPAIRGELQEAADEAEQRIMLPIDRRIEVKTKFRGLLSSIAVKQATETE